MPHAASVKGTQAANNVSIVMVLEGSLLAELGPKKATPPSVLFSGCYSLKFSSPCRDTFQKPRRLIKVHFPSIPLNDSLANEIPLPLPVFFLSIA